MKKEKRAILIHPDDNIVVVLEDVTKGEKVRYWDKGEPRLLVAKDSIVKGHKVAIRLIARKEKVVKYGVPIGIVTKQIKRGQLVHINNLVSFVREGGS
jgi:hypothetical protein